MDGIGSDKECPTYTPFETPKFQISWKEQSKAVFYKKFIFVKNQWGNTLLMVSYLEHAICFSFIKYVNTGQQF